MSTCTTNGHTTFYRVVFQCYSEDGAIELLSILSSLKVRPAFYFRQVSCLIAFLPFEYFRLIQACSKPMQCQTIRYFRLGDHESLAFDF